MNRAIKLENLKGMTPMLKEYPIGHASSFRKMFAGKTFGPLAK